MIERHSGSSPCAELRILGVADRPPLPHSKGPWSVLTDAGFLYPGIESPSGSVVIIGGEDCEDDDDSGVRGATPEEAIGNAHLLAAAPALLSAVRPLAAIPIEQFDFRHRGDDYAIMAWNGIPITVGDVRRARAAVAQAEGR